MTILSVTSEALFDDLIPSPIHVLIVIMVKTDRTSRKGLGEREKNDVQRKEKNRIIQG